MKLLVVFPSSTKVTDIPRRIVVQVTIRETPFRSQIRGEVQATDHLY
jgi:hypothetical protein